MNGTVAPPSWSFSTAAAPASGILGSADRSQVTKGFVLTRGDAGDADYSLQKDAMRGHFLPIGLVGLVAVTAGTAGSQPAAPAWPQFRANPGLTGVAAELLRPPLKVLWSFEAGETIE